MSNNFIKFDMVTRNSEFILEQGLKIAFKKKVNNLKLKKFEYKNCLVEKCNINSFKQGLNKYKKDIIEISKKEISIKNIYYIYCDGASLNNGQKAKDKPMFGSYGYIILKRINDENFRIIESNTDAAPEWTNNYSELIACLNSLKRIKYLCKDNKRSHVIVNTDSQYVTRGATTWMHDWEKKSWKNTFNKPVVNKELWIELFDLLNEFKSLKIVVRFKWTRGHIKNPNDFDSKMNNEVDNLATLALNKFRNKKSREYRDLQYTFLNIKKDKDVIKTNQI